MSDARIYALIRERIGQPFSWGTHDCAMLAFDAVHAMTGKDPAADLRGAYSTAEEAQAILRKLGGLNGICRDRFGPRIVPEDMQCGDVALLSRAACEGLTQEHGALGICWRGLIVAQAEAGLAYLPASTVLRAWRAA